ncbi:glycosyltransferase family 4 protein [Desulfovibrio mangrovi]|uniref:glycosyltransferase family 4 protein n=1 Tax=Desulfovibrio mangrovi TaxID=2976983 RepID=UPI0022466242|nr:glycosyltransferase family 4 protein [Desulfovibrio mangrovi]UZP66644.1 glycosyltransferase family 4 protein [Desulfovibrio mangrovi]
MRMAFCTPFKPLNHPRTSGDVTIAQDLFDYFAGHGHSPATVPHLSTDWIWKQPARWPAYLRARSAVRRLCDSGNGLRPDLWFTYHSYYRAPDLFGPMARRMGIPYVIFAGAHSPGRRETWNTRPGYCLNVHALKTADHVFTNKQRDLTPLLSLLPENRITFVPPGIRTERFSFNAEQRETLRAEWQAQGRTIVMTAAMLRPGVKAEGVEHVITACAALARQGRDIMLVVAGDGTERERLEAMAGELLPSRSLFLGMVDRWNLYGAYSAADLFAFPGINEGLGMVYLEAQCCGLPVVAWDHDGAPQMVEHGKTGFITPSYDGEAFARAIGLLADNRQTRTTMGEAARKHVLAHHDLNANYGMVEKRMFDMLNTSSPATRENTR